MADGQLLLVVPEQLVPAVISRNLAQVPAAVVHPAPQVVGRIRPDLVPRVRQAHLDQIFFRKSSIHELVVNRVLVVVPELAT